MGPTHQQPKGWELFGAGNGTNTSTTKGLGVVWGWQWDQHINNQRVGSCLGLAMGPTHQQPKGWELFGVGNGTNQRVGSCLGLAMGPTKGLGVVWGWKWDQPKGWELFGTGNGTNQRVGSCLGLEMGPTKGLGVVWGWQWNQWISSFVHNRHGFLKFNAQNSKRNGIITLKLLSDKPNMSYMHTWASLPPASYQGKRSSGSVIFPLIISRRRNSYKAQGHRVRYRGWSIIHPSSYSLGVRLSLSHHVLHVHRLVTQPLPGQTNLIDPFGRVAGLDFQIG